MSQPYLGEIMLFAFNFAPQGYAKCDGQLMSISQNDALFALIGTTYGGDGESTFALPDLRGRAPTHVGSGAGLSTYQLGESGGTETVTLTLQQIPTHSHTIGRNTLAAVARCRNGVGNQLTPVADLPASMPFAFSDDPVVTSQTNIRAAHVLELRYRVDAFRASEGLGVYPYADPGLTAATTLIKAQHLLDLRTAVSEARAAAGLPAVTFDPNLALNKAIKAVHINELRSALQGAPGADAPRYAAAANATMAAGAAAIGPNPNLAIGGGSQPHENMQPFLGMNYCIALYGVFPQQS